MQLVKNKMMIIIVIMKMIIKMIKIIIINMNS